MDQEQNISSSSSSTVVHDAGSPVPVPAVPSAPLPVPTDEHETFTKDFGFLPIPKYLQYDPQHPAHFGLLLNATMGFSATFSQSLRTVSARHS